jgi:hypothetical protein
MDLPFLGVSNFIDEQIKTPWKNSPNGANKEKKTKKEANPHVLFWLLVVSRLFSKMFSI